MFCPRCGSTQNEDLNFCKACGANVGAVRQLIDGKEGSKKFDWSDTWVAEMFLSGEAQKRRKAEMERARGVTPEVKRYNEIKAGVITASVGLAAMIFLAVFMQGIVIGGKVPDDTAEILSRIWLAGLIPLFVGIALIINGTFISKKIVEAAKREALLEPSPDANLLRSPDTSEFVPTRLGVPSVTEETTRHFSEGSRQ